MTILFLADDKLDVQELLSLIHSEKLLGGLLKLVVNGGGGEVRGVGSQA